MRIILRYFVVMFMFTLAGAPSLLGRNWMYRNWPKENRYLYIKIAKKPLSFPGVPYFIKKAASEFIGDGRLYLNFRHLPKCYMVDSEEMGALTCDDDCSFEYIGQIVGLKLKVKHDGLISKEDLTDYFVNEYNFKVIFQSQEDREIPNYADFVGDMKMEIVASASMPYTDLRVDCTKLYIGGCVMKESECISFNKEKLLKIMQLLSMNTLNIKIKATVRRVIDVKGRSEVCTGCPEDGEI